MPTATLAPSSIIASANFTGAVAAVDEAIGAVPINFNGSTYLGRGGALTNLADGKIVLVSCFFRVAGGAGAERRIMSIKAGTSTRFVLNVSTANVISMLGRDSGAATILNANATTTFAAGSAWHHVLVSFDLASTSNRGVYVDGVAETVTWGTYNTAGTLDLLGTTPETLIGTFDGTLSWNGDLANLFFHTPAAYVDPATALSKFIDGSGLPVDMGADGSLPLGLQPIVCMSRNWPTNDGSGGNFTVTAGALTIGTAPVDV